MSELSPLVEIITLSMAEGEKLLDKTDSSSFYLKTQLAAPVIATLTPFLDFAT